MKSISRLLLMLLVATTLAVPGESAAQTVCEGFSTVLNAMKSSSPLYSGRRDDVMADMA